jgi:hypothetical protein
MLVFVNAMIPVPGATAGEWWPTPDGRGRGVAAAQRGGYSPSFDLATYFLHDLPPAIVKEGEAHERPEADAVFGEPCRFEACPEDDVDTRPHEPRRMEGSGCPPQVLRRRLPWFCMTISRYGRG